MVVLIFLPFGTQGSAGGRTLVRTLATAKVVVGRYVYKAAARWEATAYAPAVCDAPFPGGNVAMNALQGAKKKLPNIYDASHTKAIAGRSQAAITWREWTQSGGCVLTGIQAPWTWKPP